MAYAIRVDDEWVPLRWPAVKSDGTPIRPGSAGVTAALLDAVGAVQIVDPGPVQSDTQAVESRSLVDVDGVPTVQYVMRDKTLVELEAEAAAAAAQRERDQAKQAIDNLRAYVDLASPTAAQTVAAVKLLCRVSDRLIRDAFGERD